VTYELRDRDGELDGSGPSELLAVLTGDRGLPWVLTVAGRLRVTLDVMAGDRYLVSYCGASPYWWPPRSTGAGMHQIGSHGWCHDCHKNGLGYVHHLDYDTEVAVLTSEAADDQVLRQRCEADGQTPAQYAASVAGRAVPLDGDHSFATDVHELGVNAAGLAEFAVDMWDMTTWKVAVEVAEGAPDTARRLAEKLAFDAQPKRCYDCKGLTGHSKRCGAAEQERFMAQPECGEDPCPHDPPHRTFREIIDARRAEDAKAPA
jgi:hypothetical protein